MYTHEQILEKCRNEVRALESFKEALKRRQNEGDAPLNWSKVELQIEEVKWLLGMEANNENK